MCSVEQGGQQSTLRLWCQLTELVVVALEKGLAAVLLLAGLLTAAAVAAAVFLSTGGQVGVVLEEKETAQPQRLSAFSDAHLLLRGLPAGDANSALPWLCPQWVPGSTDVPVLSCCCRAAGHKAAHQTLGAGAGLQLW